MYRKFNTERIYGLFSSPVIVADYANFLNLGVSSNFWGIDDYILYNIYNPELPLYLKDNKYEYNEEVASLPITGVTLLGAILYARHIGALLPTVTMWKDFISCNAWFKNQLLEEDLSTLNIEEKYGGIQVTDAPDSISHYLGNIAFWCAPDELNQANVSTPNETNITTYTAGCAWNKSIYDTDKYWLRKRWGGTGAVGVGLRYISREWSNGQD